MGLLDEAKKLDQQTATTSHMTRDEYSQFGQPNRELTLGERRVGINFNPSKFPQVDSIKRKAADLIDELQTYRGMAINDEGKYTGYVNEFQRAISVAQTEVESAVHWAVKAVTK